MEQPDQPLPGVGSDAVLDSPEQSRFRRFSSWLLDPHPTRAELGRFHSTYEHAEIEIERLKQPDSKEWPIRAKGYLESAKRHYSMTQMAAAWASLKAALRETILGYETSELAIEVLRMRNEAETKLGSWRLRTVKSLLDVGSSDPWDVNSRVVRLELAVGTSPQPQQKLKNRLEVIGRLLGVNDLTDDVSQSVLQMEAEVFPTLAARAVACRRILDDHADNGYAKQAILARTIRVASLILIAILAVLVVLVAWQASGDGILKDWVSLVIVLTLGALGAVLSGATSAISGSGKTRIPDLRVRRILMLTRPLIGGASAVAVVVILESGITAVSLTESGLYATAIVAGFSERLVSRSVEGVSATIEV